MPLAGSARPWHRAMGLAPRPRACGRGRGGAPARSVVGPNHALRDHPRPCDPSRRRTNELVCRDRRCARNGEDDPSGCSWTGWTSSASTGTQKRSSGPRSSWAMDSCRFEQTWADWETRPSCRSRRDEQAARRLGQQRGDRHPGRRPRGDPGEIERGLRSSSWGSCTERRSPSGACFGRLPDRSSTSPRSRGHAFPRYFVYQAAKAAAIMVSKGVAVDYGPFGIRCNAVLPGSIETPMTYEVLPPELSRARRHWRSKDSCIRSGGSASPKRSRRSWPSCSDRASLVTGTAIPVDGGATARCFGYPLPGEIVEAAGRR